MRSLADLYRVTVEKSPYGVFIVDHRDRCIYVNDAGCRLCGLTPAELLGRNLLDLLPADLQERGRAHFAIARREGVRAAQLPFPRPGGALRWWNIDALPLGDGRLLAYIDDITQRHDLDERLTREKARLDRAGDLARVGWWEFDLSTGQVFASAHTRDIYGVAPHEDFTIADVQKVPLPEYRSYLDDALRDLVAGARPYDVTFRIRRPRDGTLADIHSLAEFDRESNRVFGVLQDITEVRRLEDQLRQAQKMEAVGRLAGGVAHDFNNLLTPILGFADLLLQDYAPDDPRRRDVAAIVRAAERARDLTAQLLAFGRKQVLDVQPVNVNDVVRESEGMLRRLLRENIRLDLALAPALGTVRADVSQLHTVLINLVVNAADAMPDGGVLGIETQDVELDADYAHTHPGSAPGPHVMLAVTDQGCGMPPETLALIFEPFFTTKRTNEGTGLGLATVHGIVKQHQGSVQVYSEPGHGSVFKVYLPRVAAVAEPIAAPEAPRRLHGGERILLVEDDAAVRELAAKALERYGYAVVPAATPPAALQLLADGLERCDLLLTDVVMPAMNGVQLHRSVLEAWSELPVLYMSGYTSNVIAHHGILDAGLHFIQKPFTPQDLAAKVRAVLDG